MENPEHLQSSEEVPLPEDFQNANAIIESISQPKDSQPTKLRVKNFKNRVFHLIKIYTNHSTNVNPLVECLKQDMFLREPEKMREIVNEVLHKQNITLENLQQLLEYHKVILLFKNDKVKGDSVAVNFIKILKKISHVDENIVNETVLQLLKTFAFVRKSKLDITFFFYFFRNYEGASKIKKLFLQKCQEYANDPKLRNAQKKQLTKIRNKLDKSSKPKPVKKEEQSEDDDDIKAVGIKKNAFKELKSQKKEQELQNDKIEEQGEVKKQKKEISAEQQQKLQRMKESKKKNRKQNKNKQPQRNQKQNGQPKNEERKNNHQSKENQQRKQSKESQNFSKQKGNKNKFQKK